MVNPFRLEEVYPDAPVGPARLPRRQTGNSPQGLTVTLVADYTLLRRAWLPAQASVELLTEFGISPAAARTTINRLVRRGVLESSRRGRQAFYRLTEPAAAELAAGGQTIVAFSQEAESWDGRWTLIAFSLPQEGDSQRRALRGRLRWLGYAPLYGALWISPHTLPEGAASTLAELSLGTLTVFRAEQLEVARVTTRDPLEAWDVESIAEQYQEFVGEWEPMLRRVRSGSIRGAQAVQARTAVMDTYRGFVVLDPWVPMRMMPRGWLRDRARDVFVDVYDGLAEPALGHVHEVLARYDENPQPDLRTHSVADLLAGIRGAHS